MRLLAVLLLAFVVLSDSHAQVVYSFVPNPASTSDLIRLRIDIHNCFDEQFEITVDEAAKTVSARFDGDDTLCDDTEPANIVDPQFVDIGHLSAGNYEAQVVGCIAFPNQCQTLHVQSLTVSGQSAARSKVPTLSLCSVLMLVAALALGGWATRRS